jgi:aspartate racemase
MKTIGLLGGMSWESTVGYYTVINQEVKRKLGKLHSAKVVLYSVDFEPIEQLQHQNRWDEAADILIESAKSIQNGGADFMLICTNTMHKLYPQIQNSIDIPILHIADATAEELTNKDIKKVGLLGTAFTMEQDFYKNRLIEKYGLEVLIPEKNDREIIHKVIYEELCQGIVKNSSKDEYIKIIDKLYQKGAEGVILGCTEIAMLVKQSDTKVKLFDTTAIHAKSAVKYALSSN